MLLLTTLCLAALLAPHSGAQGGCGICGPGDETPDGFGQMLDLQQEDGSWDADALPVPDSAQACYRVQAGAPEDDLAATSLMLLSILARNDARGSAQMESFHRAEQWILGTQDKQGRFGKLGHGEDLRHHALATLALWEGTLQGKGIDASTPATMGIDFLLAQELPRGGWASRIVTLGEEGTASNRTADPVTSAWVSFALMDSLQSERMGAARELAVRAAMERTARIYRQQADPTTQLIQREDRVSPMATLCGLMIRRMDGEDLEGTLATSQALEIMIDQAPLWPEDPTYTFFMTWLTLECDRQSWKRWERVGARAPLMYTNPKSMVTLADQDLCAGSYGAQALLDMNLGIYFRYDNVLAAPPIKR